LNKQGQTEKSDHGFDLLALSAYMMSGDAYFPFIFLAANVSSVFSNGSNYIQLMQTQVMQYCLPACKTNYFDYRFRA
jgi:hypothetical protein